MDMLHGPLTKKLLLFTLPIALSSMVQQLFNAADTAVVGYFGSADALAAVGTNTEIVALIVTLSSGLAVGANVLVANLIGKQESGKIPAAVRTALLLAVFVGAAGLVLGQGLAGPLLQLIENPAGILEQAACYLRVYLLGYPFLLLYDFGAAALRAQGDSRYPFLALLFSGAVNVGLNLVFVVGLRMGVTGVAAATDVSTLLSAGMVLHRLIKEGNLAPAAHAPQFSPAFAAKILRVGIPSALQGAVFCFANIFVQASVNRFGETAIAGSTIAMNFEYFTYYSITAFGQTTTTFTSQNYAAGQRGRCREILWRSLVLSALCSAIPIYLIVGVRTFFSGLFTPDTAVIESASVRILCILLYEPLCNLYEIPAGALRGSGHAACPAVMTAVGTCAFRIVWILTVFRANPALTVLYHAFPLSWVVTILLVNSSFLVLRRKSAAKDSL